MTVEKRDEQTYAAIGSAMEVHRILGHRILGHGFLEAVYQEALEVELAARSIPFEHEVKLPILYKGRPLNCFYKADFVCYGQVLLELKALNQISGVERS